MSKNETYLRKLVRKELHSIVPEIYPGVAKLIERDHGFELAEIKVFNIAAGDAVSVQTAISLLDSELGTEYNEISTTPVSRES